VYFLPLNGEGIMDFLDTYGMSTNLIGSRSVDQSESLTGTMVDSRLTPNLTILPAMNA
jgi:hypothetical protein